MLALALAALLAQLQPIGATTAAPAAPSDVQMRHMPAGAPRIEPGDAAIRNSGSTNIAGYTIVVHPDHSADVYSNGATQHAMVGAAQAAWLFAKLDQAMPLDSLGAARCMKSASFGSTLTIAYRGQMTPDLSCAGDAAARELARTAEVIVNQIGVLPEASRLRRRLL
jgi:hypothetical protein